MTVSSENARDEFNGTGLTSYPTTFVFLLEGDLDVYREDAAGVVSLLTLTTDYTVTGGAGAVGTIETVATYSDGKVIVVRNPPFTQATDLTDGDGFASETIEQTYDKQVMLAQILKLRDEGSIRKADSDTGSESVILPSVADRTSKALGFDASGNLVANTTIPNTVTITAFAETYLDDTTIEDTRTTLGFTGTGGKATSAVMDSTLLAQLFQARLTLTTGTAVTTADVASTKDIYLTPYKGNKVALYDGTDWALFNLAEITLDLETAGHTADSNYDVFLYDNAGTLTLETLIWTNDTTRATALVLQDGVYCKTGDLTRRYVGTIRTNGTADRTEDTEAKRFVWNYYNRLPRNMVVVDTTDSWTYAVEDVWRQANASATNQLAFVVGVNEEPLRLTSYGLGIESGNNDIFVGVGLDSTTATVAKTTSSTTPSAGVRVSLSAQYEDYVAVGYHYAAWLEYNSGGGTATFYGDNANVHQTGIMGTIQG